MIKVVLRHDVRKDTTALFVEDSLYIPSKMVKSEDEEEETQRTIITE